MSDTNKSYRIRTKINSSDEADRYVSVKLEQDFDIIELLSLKIDTSNFYKFHTSNYGCVAGRVLANGGVGIPNAKISVFIQRESDSSIDNEILNELYPYLNAFGKNGDQVRYNLFPEEQVSTCHAPIGTFPSKRMVLDDNNYIEIYDRYYKYTTRSNDSGDYMIFGVPVGTQTIHTDIDLSDIGMLSQKPRDMIYKGYNINQFENANRFKQDSNIDSLTQVITQNNSIYVYPFWGEEDEDDIRITRNDVDVQYKFEPTCVFLGSIVTDEKSNGISKNCIATERMGKMDKLTTGAGTIEMIRKTIDNEVEELSINGNDLIDGNGTWCYQIPMNLDYYMTDEYGNFVPSDDKEKGIPTRARVRFRVSLSDFQSDFENNHVSKILVPNNPKTFDDLDYHFGSLTVDDTYGTKSFRDLFWNNVYTVKSYIPRIQNSTSPKRKKFIGFKQVNVNAGNNPIPYNNMRVNPTFMFILQCAILKILIKIVTFVNRLNIAIKHYDYSKNKKCTVLGDGICPDLENWYFAPGCKDMKYLKTTAETIQEEGDGESIDVQNADTPTTTSYCVTNQIDYLMQCVEINLAMEYEVIQFDFYNDWINGMVYIPRWFAQIRKKRRYFFGLFKRSARTYACVEGFNNKSRLFYQQCALTYKDANNDGIYTNVTTPRGCKNNSKQKCHTGYGRKVVKALVGRGGGGLIHSEETLKGQKVYYAKPAEWHNVANNDYNTKCNLFATDIVLIGSLNDEDINGIPKAFENLTSTTYNMPSNLASTNLDHEGFMYQYSGNGSYCTGIKYYQAPLEVKEEEKIADYQSWSKNTDNYGEYMRDIDEYAITESSGVDWGYHGPNQKGNSLEHLYFPGGHFLGISCFHSETNIKSCVNLSRICEIGAMQSQRQLIESNFDSDRRDYVGTYLIPNGLISKYELNDSNFRNIFATLNFNGLKTKIDPTTGYLKYDFSYVHPTSFNGELVEFINNENEKYNVGPIPDNNAEREITGSGFQNKAYIQAIENRSDDYYRFRFGLNDEYMNLHRKHGSRDRYMIVNGKNVSMPIYENSFYFYFGLQIGNTAIERFFKNFYAKCDKVDEDTSYINVIPHNTNYCDEFSGSADVTVTGMYSPYTLKVTRDNVDKFLQINGNVITVSETGNVNTVQEISHYYNNFTLTNLRTGKYEITMTSKNADLAIRKFEINEDVDEILLGISSSSVDFSTTDRSLLYDYSSLANRGVTASGEVEYGGYITVNGITDTSKIAAIIIYTDDTYTFVIMNDDYTSAFVNGVINDRRLFNTDDMKFITPKEEWKRFTECVIPAWKPNDRYHVATLFICDGFDPKIHQINAHMIEMPSLVDILIGDEDLSYRFLINYKGYSRENWYKQVLESNDPDITEKMKWNLKQALYYRYSLYDGMPNGNIMVYPAYGLPPYNVVVDGNAEKVEFVYDSDENAYQRVVSTNDLGIEKDLNAFYLPTHYFENPGQGSTYGLDLTRFTTYEMPYDQITNETVSEGFMTPRKDFGGDIMKTPYTISVSDKNGMSLSGLYLPSIYRPFFVNAVMFTRYSEIAPIWGSTVHFNIAITNAIPYNGNLNKIEINGKDHTEYSRKAISRRELDLTTTGYAKIYAPSGEDLKFIENQGKGVRTYSTNFYKFTYECTPEEWSNQNFSLYIEEGLPSADFVSTITPMSISGSKSCIFPSDNIMGKMQFSNGLRFFYFQNGSAIAGKMESNDISLAKDTFPHNYNSAIVYTGPYEPMDNGEYHANDITDKVRECETFADFLNMVNSDYPQGVFAIYDDVTMGVGLEFTEEEHIPESYWYGKAPHTNNLSIVRYYPSSSYTPY